MNYQPLKYIYQPATVANAYTLLLLHGTGGDETDLLPIAEKFGKEVNILSLRGNVSESGMPRFFRRLGMGVFDEKDLAFRTHEMVAFINTIAQKEGFDAHRLIALGYSNGANIAGGVLQLYPNYLAGAILLRPMQPFKQVDTEAKNSSHTPLFLSNGIADPTIQPQATVQYISNLQHAGFNVEAHSLQTGHNLTMQDIMLAMEWFKKHFQQ